MKLIKSILPILVTPMFSTCSVKRTKNLESINNPSHHTGLNIQDLDLNKDNVVDSSEINFFNSQNKLLETDMPFIVILIIVGLTLSIVFSHQLYSFIKNKKN